MKLQETNIDIKTGIRYGVIQANNANYFFDDAEPIYPEIDATDDELEMEHVEPLCFQIRDDNLQAHTFWDATCIMITNSEYYTFTRLCSPCVPNAGGLDNPDEKGYKTYCLGHDFFGVEGAPYRVFRVLDDSEIIIEHD